MSNVTLNTVRIYKVTVTKAFVASMELGEHLSLTPWGNDTAQYEGYDDDGQDYLLPLGYEVAEDSCGGLQIYDAQANHCTIITHPSGRPQLVTSDPHNMPVLALI